MALNAIVFDLDGTLVDSADAILRGFAFALENNGVTARCPLEQSLIGPPLMQTLARISGVEDPALLVQMAADFKAWYDGEGCLTTPAYAGVDAMLKALVLAGVPLFIATNKRLHPTERIIKALGWDRHFRAVYALDARTPAYPAKGEMVSALLVEHGLATDAVIYIGDTAGDEQASRQAGVQFWGVDWGYGDLAALDVPVLSTAAEILGRVAAWR
ncbi:phosphoglycolate phosphatase [Andreprevotia lacus DSM 23236]|uniref:Phosphoglycolate phosphatase n=1 Tax=Andreprevotia lacus DSM 23236 TaxID=1121001 RepID=A0A1W1Y0Y7_9NEIS|nr:phosphoglycolate phosphatase [Andreprevotia lacus DSM 23236]